MSYGAPPTWKVDFARISDELEYLVLDTDEHLGERPDAEVEASHWDLEDAESYGPGIYLVVITRVDSEEHDEEVERLVAHVVNTPT